MARCIQPWYDKDKGQNFPCGKCHACRQQRASQWGFRLMQESRQSMSALFVTLTYNTEHVPITKKGRLSLRHQHVVDFMKKLRYEQKKEHDKKIIFYAVGEYGSKTQRPHYHLLIFNAHHKHVFESWKYGNVFIGTVTPASAGYTLKYMSKNKLIPQYKGDDREPEKVTMSKGIGLSYLTDAVIAWHYADLEKRAYCLYQNYKIAMPRYYKDRIYSEMEKYDIQQYLNDLFTEQDEKESIQEKLDRCAQELGKKHRFERQAKKSLKL